MMENNSGKNDNASLFAYLVHEVRTPLVCTQSMLRDILTGEEIKREQIESCEKSVTTLLEYLNQTLDMLKVSEGQLKLNVAPITLGEIEEILYKYYAIQAKDHQVSFEVETGESPFRYIYLDKGISLQIANNLIGNAFKYTPAGGKVKVRIGITEIEEYRCIFRVEIIDNGRGMTKEFLEKAFLPFTQENGYIPGKGAGLGLNLTRKLIQFLGGEMEIHSEKGKGTTVCVRIEADAADEDYSVKQQNDETGGQQNKIIDKETLRGKKLLIAEDDDVIMEWMVDAFEKYGVWVDKTYDGNEVVALFEESKPFEYDAILMDMGMPECNGMEATFRIRHLEREDAKEIPIIAYTGFPLENEEEFLRRNRIQKIVPKTLNAEEVVQRLGEIWESYGNKE